MAQTKRHFSMMRMLVTMAAFSLGAWDFRQGAVGQFNAMGSPFYSPKRTKFKGWQRAARQA